MQHAGCAHMGNRVAKRMGPRRDSRRNASLTVGPIRLPEDGPTTKKRVARLLRSAKHVRFEP